MVVSVPRARRWKNWQPTNGAFCCGSWGRRGFSPESELGRLMAEAGKAAVAKRKMVSPEFLVPDVLCGGILPRCTGIQDPRLFFAAAGVCGGGPGCGKDSFRAARERRSGSAERGKEGGKCGRLYLDRCSGLALSRARSAGREDCGGSYDARVQVLRDGRGG